MKTRRSNRIYLQFISGKAVETYINRQWYGTNTNVTKSMPLGLITIFYWFVVFHLLPFGILFYALPRYGSRYRIFLDHVTKRISPAIRYFVDNLAHAGFILLLVNDSVRTEGLRVNGKADATDGFVCFFVSSYLLHEIGQLVIQGPKIYFSSWSNLLDVCIVLLFVAYLITRLIDIFSLNKDVGEAIPYLTIASLSAALASFLFILRFISYLSVLRTVGIIVISFKQIIRDILSFLFLWGLLLLAFSVVISRVYPVAAYRHIEHLEECIRLGLETGPRQNISGTNYTDTIWREVIRVCLVDLYNLVVPKAVQGYVAVCPNLP